MKEQMGARSARKAAVSQGRGRRNQAGQAMGAKGLQTRRRFLDATAELIKTRPLRELTVSDITRLANTSASTFYLYFNDVPEAVLGVIQGVSQSTPELLEMLDRPWEGDASLEQAQAFVESYVESWKANADLFRVRNLAADEGDERFETARRLSLWPLIEALARRIESNQQAGVVQAGVDPLGAAAAIVAMLERVAGTPHYYTAAGTAVAFGKVLHAAAFFANSVLGSGAPAEARSRDG